MHGLKSFFLVKKTILVTQTVSDTYNSTYAIFILVRPVKGRKDKNMYCYMY